MKSNMALQPFQGGGHYGYWDWINAGVNWAYNNPETVQQAANNVQNFVNRQYKAQQDFYSKAQRLFKDNTGKRIKYHPTAGGYSNSRPYYLYRKKKYYRKKKRTYRKKWC